MPEQDMAKMSVDELCHKIWTRCDAQGEARGELVRRYAERVELAEKFRLAEAECVALREVEKTARAYQDDDNNDNDRALSIALIRLNAVRSRAASLAAGVGVGKKP